MDRTGRRLPGMMSAGSPTQALARATSAANTLQAHLHGPDAHALLGELHLISATSLTQDRHRAGNARAEEIRGHLAEAADLAGRTGEAEHAGRAEDGALDVPAGAENSFGGTSPRSGTGVVPSSATSRVRDA